MKGEIPVQLLIIFFKFFKMELQVEKMPRKLLIQGLIDNWSETIYNVITLIFPFVLKKASFYLSNNEISLAVLCLIVFCLKRNVLGIIKSLMKSISTIYNEEQRMEVKREAMNFIINKEIDKERVGRSISIENYISNVWKIQVSYVAEIVSFMITIFAIYNAVISTELSTIESICFVLLGLIRLLIIEKIGNKNNKYYQQHRSYQKEERRLIREVLNNESTLTSLTEFKQGTQRNEITNVETYNWTKFLFKEINSICEICFKIFYIISFTMLNPIDAHIMTELIANIAIFDSIFDSYKEISKLLIARAEKINVIRRELVELKKII